ncbi:hypothetical protein A3K64_02480 [Candidatus Micrarchaeota archaeon RBG_16_36_9]|nr:MAG: hypothetical protein A3K64_02480 [Candidatus Micrarchaeota archaeon RBG_16_36_9]
MKNSLIAFIILVAVVFASIYIYYNSSESIFKDPYSLYYEGDVRHFRANLFEANKTPVYPNENAIKDVLLNPDIFKIYIAYIPNNSENSYYLASSFELTIKLGLVYRHYIQGNTTTFKDVDGSSCLAFLEQGRSICFRSYPINSTSELEPTSVEPVILLLGPSQANQTAVTVQNNEIIIEGKNVTQINRNYNDLDLAVDKVLLTLMV